MEHKKTFNIQRGSKIPLTQFLPLLFNNVATAARFTNVLDSAP